jgi:hypothetical protein
MAPPETGTSVDPTTTEATESNSASKAAVQPSATNLDSGPVQAYAKLEGDEFCYYIRTLQVTLGRKGSKNENVDIPLGATKSVSRQHARLFYNFTTQRFEMMVFGKNGAFVNEHFVEKGVTVPLENRSVFVLWYRFWDPSFIEFFFFFFFFFFLLLEPRSKLVRWHFYSFCPEWIWRSHHKQKVWVI